MSCVALLSALWPGLLAEKGRNHSSKRGHDSSHFECFSRDAQDLGDTECRSDTSARTPTGFFATWGLWTSRELPQKGETMESATTVISKRCRMPGGSRNRSHLITCNGEPLPVTANLFYALTYLRLPDQPRTLWVDAICINQDRSH
jgi:hypothetical protein